MKAKNDRLTKEERLALADKAAKEAEELAKREAKGQHASPSPSPAGVSPSPTEAAPSPSPSPQAPSPSPSPEPFKKKAIEQGKENIILNAKLKKTNEAIDAAAIVADPTEEEMRVEYPEWDDMTDIEKKTATKTVKAGKQLDIIHKARLEGRNVEEWSANVEKFVSDPKTLVAHPELEGKTDDFLLYAIQPRLANLPFDVLISAFLHDETKNMKPKKKEMFPSGEHRGEPMKKHSDKISLDEARKIRETDYPRYRQLVKEHKIDNTITT